MGANDDKRENKRGHGKWRGRGRGRGLGHSGNKQCWNRPKHIEKCNKDQSDRTNITITPNDSKSSQRSQEKDRVFSYSQLIPEADLGITEFIYKENKISGILKQRYSDFIVHEIDPDGNVVKLTNLELPEKSEAGNSLDCEKSSIIPEDKWQELTNLLEKPKEGEPIPQDVKIDVTDLDKDSRRNTHTAIRKVFGRKLQSNTLEKDGRKMILVKKWTGSDSRGNWTRGKDEEFLHFVVYKQDMDTSETVNRISERLRFKPSNLNFAGTKDRRACTSQKMSLWHGEPNRFKNLNIRNVWIGNYEFKAQTIKLGQLKGNLFSVALRDISNTDEEVSKSMTSLKENGFINYFGTQRFGTNKDAPTHVVGKALLQADWEKAVNLILHPRETKGGIEEALKCWQKEKDGKKALSLVKGSRSSLEVSLLRGLAEAGKNDYLRALNKLPRNLRLLYLHAYQSFIWNRIVSRRIQQFGLKTLPGDLVFQENDDSRVETSDIDVLAQDENLANQSSQADKKLEAPRSEQNDCVKVRVISAEEAEVIPIDQIVLPTPGFKITFPENELKEWYTEMLAEDGFTIESLRLNSKEYSIGGSYRNIITKPSKLDWKILRYKEPKSPLLRTDPEELQGSPEPQDDPDGTLRALIVNIGLDSSTYATIALREVVDYVGALQRKNAQTETEDTEIGKKTINDLEITDEIPLGKAKTEGDASCNTTKECGEGSRADEDLVEDDELIAGKRELDDEETPSKKMKVECGGKEE